MNWIAVKVKIYLKKIQFLWFDFNIVIMVHQVNKHGTQRGGGISYFWWVRPKFPAAPVLQPETWNKSRRSRTECNRGVTGLAGEARQDKEWEWKTSWSRTHGWIPKHLTTWNVWHSTRESQGAALPEATGSLRRTVGYAWVLLEPSQFQWGD